MTTLDNYMLLYHRLQSPSSEKRPQLIQDARSCLLELLDQVVYQANHKSTSILTLKYYTRQALDSYLSEDHTRTTNAWSAYLVRRRAGGQRELLPTRSYAETWLELAAPVKLVDGAWLARIHHGHTPSSLQHVTRILWQVFSEELGDGDLTKNHVDLYTKLLRSFGCKLPAADTIEFVDPKVNQNEDEGMWKAAVVQLALGLFPDEFLAEVLGFTLAYECVGLDTLIAAYELKELRLDPTYFNLHLTIDNADTGHTAMALDAVMKFMDGSNEDDRQRRWRRVQAGFLLATEIHSTPCPPKAIAHTVLDIFSRKVGSSNAAHQGCKGSIGGLRGMSLQAWMDPSGWEKRKFRFITALTNSRWVVQGLPNESPLVRELGWKGRMFGAFTVKEKAIVERWIEGLEPQIDQSIYRGSYLDLVGIMPKQMNILKPMHFLMATELTAADTVDFSTVVLTDPMNPYEIAVLLLNSLLPLHQSLVNPVKAATYERMSALRILRILNGFSAKVYDAVDGMDEVYNPSRQSISELAKQMISDTKSASLSEDIPERRSPWGWLDCVALDPNSNWWFLLGVQYGFVINLMVNRAFLHSSGVHEEVTNSLEALGSTILGEMACLRLEDKQECQLGLSAVSWALRG